VIASLRGTLSEKAAGTCTIEAGGVGYLVFVSAHTWAALPERGATAYLRTRQIVREDALQLFGFADPEELRLFDLLIAVSGVGPRLALALLSGLRPQALARAIRDEQVGALVVVPGIGRKTAERLIVELRDKVEVAPGSSSPGSLPPGSGRHQDAVAALTRLGYTSTQAQDALRRISGDAKDLALEDLVRKALAVLGKAAALAR
jgi:Holliday junction DNA helicase RuvA